MTDEYGPCETPETYPVRCDVSADDLRELKELFLDAESPYGKNQARTWPPRDVHGNIYPIWYTADDLTDGKLYDDDWCQFDPFGGNLEPVDVSDGERPYCNTPLTKWRDRYPSVRYCGRGVNENNIDDDERDWFTFCPIHRNRRHTMKTAEEALQTGLHTKTLDHLYEKVGPWKKLVGWGTFESLMGQSSYDFGMEYQEQSFDFSGEPIRPDGCDEDGILTVKCGYPTQHLDPSLSLFAASMMSVQMITVQPRIMHEDREEGEGMMESKTMERAQLTAAPSEYDSSPQEFKTLKTWSEHHLNLPLSRLVSDREKLLELGGVSTDPDAKDDEVSEDEIVLEIEADGENVDTKEDPSDPNQFSDNTAVSEEIADAIESNTTADG